MIPAILPSTRERRRHVRAVQSFRDALNRRDMDAVRNHVAPDIVVCDQSGHRIEGRERYLAMQDSFLKAAGYPTIILDSVEPNRDEVLVRGHVEGGDQRVNGTIMWRVSFEGQSISQIEITRSADGISLPRFASVFRKREERAASFA